MTSYNNIKYNNKEGIVTAIEQDEIYIDGKPFFTDDFKSRCIVSASQAVVGDKVIFNFNEKTRKLIFLRMRHPYYKGTEARSHGGSDDPEDSLYGCDLDAMGYHHLGMEG